PSRCRRRRTRSGSRPTSSSRPTGSSPSPCPCPSVDVARRRLRDTSMNTTAFRTLVVIGCVAAPALSATATPPPIQLTANGTVQAVTVPPTDLPDGRTQYDCVADVGDWGVGLTLISADDEFPSLIGVARIEDRLGATLDVAISATQPLSMPCATHHSLPRLA